MNYNLKRLVDYLVNDLDKKLAVLGFIFSVFLLIYLLSSQYFLNVNRIIYITPSLLIAFSCIIWLYIRNTVSIKRSIFFTNLRVYIIANILFFIFFSLSLLSIYLSPDIYQRPISYFIFTSFMAGFISIQIFSLSCKKKYVYFTLLQILIFGLSIVLSQLSLFPNVIGVDPWWHQMFTLEIINNGFIPSNFSYTKLPIFHLLISNVAILTEINYKFAMIISVSSTQVIINGIIVYLIGRILFNDKIGLFGSLLLLTSNIHINFGFWAIPNTLGGTLIILMIFIIFKFKNDIIFPILFLLLSFTLIATHALASMTFSIILLIMFLIYLFYIKFYNKFNLQISITTVILFTVMMYSWWIYVSNNIQNLADLIRLGFTIENSVPHVPVEITGYLLKLSLLEQLVNSLGIFLFFGLSICGFLYMVNKKYTTGNRFIFVLVGIITLMFGYFPYITGFSLIENRWWYIAQILLSIPLSITIISFSSFITRKKFKLTFIMGFTIIFSFLMITSVMANLDNHFLSPNTAGRSAFTTSELQSMETISKNYNGVIDADWASHSPISFYFNHQFKSIDDSIIKGNFSQNHKDLILIRDEIIKDPFSSFYGTVKLNSDPRINLNNQGYSKIYTSGTCDGFIG